MLCNRCGKPLGAEGHIHTCSPTPQWISEQEAQHLIDSAIDYGHNEPKASGWRKRKIQNVQRTSEVLLRDTRLLGNQPDDPKKLPD